ncbi:MAG TPA: NTPase [Candidatus Aenigmarchaeota archaeon]|nr:NTPase [Candidatus Aenigmarchaeota archaeon]
MKMFITGRPGCGKSTLINSIIMQLKEKRISGILSLEIREGKKRVGFMIRDIKSGEKNILASVDMDGPKIGKYGVNLSGLERIVSRFLEGFGNSDVVLIDEIGKMEMLSEKFREAVDIVLNSNKDVVAVVGLGFVDYVRDKGEILVLTRSNFDSIREKILERLK